MEFIRRNSGILRWEQQIYAAEQRLEMKVPAMPD
jgi:hypothetical protein